MKKLHTRQKRKLDLTSSKTGKDLIKKRKKRPTSFRTETAAHAWAEKRKYKKDTYKLIKVKKGKKFQVKKI
ncbi:hypothetical protein KY317_02545 [Candidatus Woesearchaeota archaeon]|nr:hypothetical protein [Candidatus Woesearchaeota archaeon]